MVRGKSFQPPPPSPSTAHATRSTHPDIAYIHSSTSAATMTKPRSPVRKRNPGCLRRPRASLHAAMPKPARAASRGTSTASPKRPEWALSAGTPTHLTTKWQRQETGEANTHGRWSLLPGCAVVSAHTGSTGRPRTGRGLPQERSRRVGGNDNDNGNDKDAAHCTSAATRASHERGFNGHLFMQHHALTSLPRTRHWPALR